MQFGKCLEREVATAEKDKAGFIKEFSEADYEAVVGGWKVSNSYHSSVSQACSSAHFLNYNGYYITHRGNAVSVNLRSYGLAYSSPALFLLLLCQGHWEDLAGIVQRCFTYVERRNRLTLSVMPAGQACACW